MIFDSTTRGHIFSGPRETPGYDNRDAFRNSVSRAAPYGVLTYHCLPTYSVL